MYMSEKAIVGGKRESVQTDRDRKAQRERVRERIGALSPVNQKRIISGLKINFSLFPCYFAHRS